MLLKFRPAFQTARDSRSACSLRCNALKLSATSALFGAGLFIASPFVALWNVSHAIETKDMAALNHQINWRSLARSIKDQATGPVPDIHAASDDLPDFGSSFTRNAISNAVDLAVTPNNLSTIMDEAMPETALPGPQIGHMGGIGVLRHAHAHFVSANRFEASLRLPGHEHETPLRITMKIESWRWKVTQVRFPERSPRTDHPMMEASASASHA